MRVLVVRPQVEAGETASRLAELGHEAVIAPILTIRPGALPPPDGPFDAILVTSRNAVPAMALRRSLFAAAPILAVGPRTGDDLRSHGFEPAGIAAGDGISLAGLVGTRLRPGARLLHVAGRDRRPEPAGLLEAAGYSLTVWEAYAAEAARHLPEHAREALASGRLDAALHYSPRSAALLRGLVEAEYLTGAFGMLLHVCLSANVAASLGGEERIEIATEPSEDALLRLLSRTRAD